MAVQSICVQNKILCLDIGLPMLSVILRKNVFQQHVCALCTAQCTGWTLAFSGLAPSSEEEESSSMRTEFHNRLFNACAERKPPSFLALPSHAGVLLTNLFCTKVNSVKLWRSSNTEMVIECIQRYISEDLLHFKCLETLQC